MTSLDERIVKVKGWKITRNEDAEYIGAYFWSNGESCGSPRVSSEWFFNLSHAKDYLPKWSSSLDLMHDLEKDLDGYEWERYRIVLTRIVMLRKTLKPEPLSVIHATAEQKAKAWLKVKETS